MNRRFFASATLGAGTFLLAGLTLPTTPAFAKTKDNDDEDSSSPKRTESDDAGDDLVSHVVSSQRRTYDSESPMAFVIATGIEMDRKRYASDMFDNLLTTGITTFESEGIVFDDERDYGDLADHGYLYLGVVDLGDDAPAINVAVLYTQLGKCAYAIAAGNLDDPTALIDEYYETLFDEDREETDLLLSEDEMPRGFVISEDIDDILSEEPDSDRDDRKDDDEDEDDRKGRAGRTLVAALAPARIRVA